MSLLACRCPCSLPRPSRRRRRSRLCQARQAGSACPGRTDICTTPLKTTALNPNGYGSTGQSPVAKNAGDRLLLRLSDGQPRPRHEQRPHARRRRGEGGGRQPVRALRRRLPDVRADLSPDDRRRGRRRRRRRRLSRPPIAIAYGDVRAAWREYLAKHNKGRPFVLIGHSQGSLMLQQLIANEIEGKPERQADEAGDHSRLQRAGAAGQAGRRHVQVDAGLLEAGPDRLRHDLGQLPREERPAGRRDLRRMPTSPA